MTLEEKETVKCLLLAFLTQNRTVIRQMFESGEMTPEVAERTHVLYKRIQKERVRCIDDAYARAKSTVGTD